jgi:hypothetical protein
MARTQLQQPAAAFTGIAVTLVVGAAGAQQGFAALSVVLTASALKVGTSPSVWNVSHAIPLGSVTQYLFERA